MIYLEIADRWYFSLFSQLRRDFLPSPLDLFHSLRSRQSCHFCQDAIVRRGTRIARVVAGEFLASLLLSFIHNWIVFGEQVIAAGCQGLRHHVLQGGQFISEAGHALFEGINLVLLEESFDAG